jgi:hypothetical protein
VAAEGGGVARHCCLFRGFGRPSALRGFGVWTTEAERNRQKCGVERGLNFPSLGYRKKEITLSQT